MYKIGFLILHYISLEETIKCVESIIKRIDNQNYEIIIVDNASPNNSGVKLKEMYKEQDKIHVLINEKNLGFSGGNNIGFEFAKKNLKCDFIVMTNNDTYLVQDNFFEKILEEYEKSKFAVLGPKILLRDNKVYYYDGRMKTKKMVLKTIFVFYIKLILEYLHLRKYIFKNSKLRIEDNKYLNKKKYDVQLHGCCLVFSPEYISKFDGIENKTFLYCEEDFLYLRLKMNNLLSVYNPEVLIFHESNVATKKSNKNERKSKIFQYKNLIKANNILLKELNKYDKFIKENRKNG